MGKSNGITHTGQTNAVAVKFEPLQTTQTGQPAAQTVEATEQRQPVEKVLRN